VLLLSFILLGCIWQFLFNVHVLLLLFVLQLHEL